MNEFARIVDGGYCIGCGLCHAASAGQLPIRLDEFGQFRADLRDTTRLGEEDWSAVMKTCPFSDAGPNEDEIAIATFGPTAQHDARIGYYRGCYAGYAAEGGCREAGASGGVLTWILCTLLREKRIDAVAHVKSADPNKDGLLFRYTLSRTPEEVMAGTKSRYYPVELSAVIEGIRGTEGRYAVVGLPCFIKGLRRLMAIDPVLRERVRYCIGLVCGHLKSKAFADSFGWQAGIAPGALDAIDFRVKLKDRPASAYGVRVAGGGQEVVRPCSEFFGSNWGYGFFKYSACEFCDDVFSETADVSVGDAWMPQYINDPLGNSEVITRSAEMEELIQAGISSGRLHLDTCHPDQMATSQAGGLRHRRLGLAHRLALKQKAGAWTPAKRVVPSRVVGRRRLYEVREDMRARSHTLWAESVAKGDFSHFVAGMQALMRLHDRLARPLWLRVLQRLRRLFQS